MSIEGQSHFLTLYFPGFVCTRPRYQVSVYRTIGPLVIVCNPAGVSNKHCLLPFYISNSSQLSKRFLQLVKGSQLCSPWLDKILTSIKGRNSVANLQKKMTLYNPNVDLVKDNVYTKFG